MGNKNDEFIVTFTQSQRLAGFQTPVASKSYTIKKGLSEKERMAIALTIMEEVSVNFEYRQGWGWWVGRGSSSYELCDIPSNFLGLYKEMFGMSQKDIEKEIELLNVEQSLQVFKENPNCFKEKNKTSTPKFFPTKGVVDKGTVPKKFTEITPAKKSDKFRDMNYYEDTKEGARKLDPRNGMGVCFTAGTKIKLADGTDKNIESIKEGDYVKTYNFENGLIENQQVIETTINKTQELVKIVFDNDTYNVNTPEHPYFVKNKGWCSRNPVKSNAKYNLDVKQIVTGDICFFYTEQGLKEVKVIKIEDVSESMLVYNLSNVAHNHNFFANGILVHNKKTSK